MGESLGTPETHGEILPVGCVLLSSWHGKQDFWDAYVTMISQYKMTDVHGFPPWLLKLNPLLLRGSAGTLAWSTVILSHLLSCYGATEESTFELSISFLPTRVPVFLSRRS